MEPRLNVASDVHVGSYREFGEAVRRHGMSHSRCVRPTAVATGPGEHSVAPVRAPCKPTPTMKLAETWRTFAHTHTHTRARTMSAQTSSVTSFLLCNSPHLPVLANITVNFSGPGTAFGPVCVCLCARTINF